MQDTDSLKQFTERENLQVVHIKLGKTDHWIALSTVSWADGEIKIYDSLQLTPTGHTQKVIARYLKSKLPSITIKVVNVAKQEGASDCGLYAITMMTSIANNDNPVNVIYNKQELRIHLQQCFENGITEKFPISKERRLKNRI